MSAATKKPVKGKAEAVKAGRSEPGFLSREARIVAGRTLRGTVPRTSHAGWKQPAKRRDPIDILEESNRDRLPQMVPIRYGRMLQSLFTFLRAPRG